ncbi:MAG: tRNA (5-methylaminomethyl-2-thiouridine)(34)-methyltransferase MnmD [Pseudomonadota bacterium]
MGSRVGEYDNGIKDDGEGHSVSFNAHGVPISSVFGDAYFAYQNGFEETKEVFLGGNDLAGRWASGGALRIGELGFGTGLNFIATLQAWRDRQSPVDAKHAGDSAEPRLSYVAFEQHPLDADDVRRALGPWPELASFVDELLAFDPPVSGRNDRIFPDVDLQVHIGDARSMVRDMTDGVDAWYLDGFAPNRNPELWGEELMADVFERTAPGGTFSTYTAAGWVRRNLQGAGFDVSKVPGYGSKRERLQGVKPGP